MKINSLIKIILILLIFCNLKVTAQIDFENYKPLYCQGKIPDGFLKNKENIILYEKTNTRDEKYYLLLSNYLINEILFSGDILYGDPMTTYINKVADKILEKDIKLRGELQFYVLKSNEINAVATNNGVVLVTTGLLSAVKNEAQLAFILCHEIQHYSLKHQFKEDKNSSKLSPAESKDLNSGERIRYYYKFSDKDEKEADNKGFELFASTQYSQKEALNSLLILQPGNLFFKIYKFKISDFEDNNFFFPTVLKNKIIEKYNSEITGKENKDESDDQSAASFTEKRKNVLSSLLMDTLDNKSLSLVGEEEFRTTQKIARHEYLIKQIKYNDYLGGYFTALSMEKIYGTSDFITKGKVHCLYAIAIHQFHNNENIGKKDINAIPDSSRKLFYTLFNSLTRKEMIAFCARNIWLENAKGGYKNYCDAIYLHAFSSGYLKYNTLLKFSIDNSKREKSYNYHFFYDLNKNEAFVKYIKDLKRNNPDVFSIVTDKETEDENDSEKPGVEAKDKKKVKSKTLMHPKISKEILNILIIEPAYIEYDNRKRTEKRLIASEAKTQKNIKKNIKEISPKLNLSVVFLENKKTDELTTEKLADYSKMMDWLTERLSNDTGIFIQYFAEEAAAIARKNNCKYMAWLGYSYSIEKRKLVRSGVEVLIPPAMIVSALITENNFASYSLVMDLETGAIKFISSESVIHNNRVDFKEAYLYNQLKTIRLNMQ